MNSIIGIFILCLITFIIGFVFPRIEINYKVSLKNKDTDIEYTDKELEIICNTLEEFSDMLQEVEADMLEKIEKENSSLISQNPLNNPQEDK